MSKPVFSPTQFELRNELPTVVSAEQLAQITQATDRVNVQLNWVAQILGWSGPNYWTNLPSTVSEKRALLGGTFAVYNSFTLLPLKEVRTWEPSLITEKRPNVAVGQRVIIGDQQAYIYELDEGPDYLSLNIGQISDEIIALLEGGAAVKVDCKENRPFPFYRPEPLASGDASFRCSTGTLLRTSAFYEYYSLVLSPFSQDGLVLPYVNLQFYGGSYYYFDRAVYISYTEENLVPWIEAQWIESKGLWQLYVPVEAIGNNISVVWSYASQGKKTIAYTSAQVVEWRDPSDWGEAGAGFNPVLDVFSIEKSYDISGLNFSLGSYLHLGDRPPANTNPLWFDAGRNQLYGLTNDQWTECGRGTAFLTLQDQSSPPPYTYDITPGTVWQSPTGRTFIWDAGFEPAEFYYFFPNGIKDGFFYIDPTLQNVQGLYLFTPDQFYIHYPNGITPEGLIFFNCLPDEDGFYVNDPNVTAPDWYEVEFFNESLLTSVFTPAYASYLAVAVDGVEIPNIFETSDYLIKWDVRGDFLHIAYKAKTANGETFVPTITILSDFGANPDVIDVSDDFTGRAEEVTSVPYNERGPLNNFLGVWGNKGGVRPLDFVFDALDIHGFDEREALYLRPVDMLLDYDWILSEVAGKKCYVGDQPPATARVGDYYWNNETGAFAVLYLDRDRVSTWVEINYPISPCQIGSPDCNFFPLKTILSTGSCFTDNGDLWQDPVTPGVAMYYEAPNGVDVWVETNWDQIAGAERGWPLSQAPDPQPQFDSVVIYITDDFIRLEPDVPYETEDYTFVYSILPLECAYRFQYTAMTSEGVQKFPTVWAGPADLGFAPISIGDRVFSNAEFYIGPAVQNAGATLRPWKTVSLEVANEVSLVEGTYANPLLADYNKGPGDENWDRSFVRLPSEYARENKVWNKARLAVQDFTYGGTSGTEKDMKCPTLIQTPQIYEEVVFYGKNPSVGTLLYSEPYLFSDVQGFFNLNEYFQEPTNELGEYQLANFDFAVDGQFDEWVEADLLEYEPLHYRKTVPGGDWEGVYVEPTGNRPLSGYVSRDLRVKSAIPMAPPVWDASIYKYPPLCPQGFESYIEDPNNCKVGYAYFAADLSASEDGFFDQQKDVAWREPLVEDQTLYMLN